MKNKDYIKYGKDIYGRQRYKHKVSGNVTIDPAESRLSCTDTIEKAINLFAYEGIPLRKIARLYQVSHTTVMRWVYERCKSLDYTANIDAESITEVQIDEIYVITNNKKIRAKHEYMYIAIDQKTKCILGYHYGTRCVKDTKTFLTSLLTKFKNITKVHSDAFKPYIKYLDKIKNMVHTTTKDLTTHIESLNSNIRHRLSAFNRRSRNFMKKSENLLTLFNGFSYKYNYQLK